MHYTCGVFLCVSIRQRNFLFPLSLRVFDFMNKNEKDDCIPYKQVCQSTAKMAARQ